MLAAAVVIDPGVEPETAPVCLHPSEYNLGEVIRELRRFSLVSYDDDLPPTTGGKLADGDRTITTNLIVQDLIRVRYDNMSEALNRLANHVVRWLSAAIQLNHLERASVMFNHANALAEHLLRLDVRGKYVPYLYGNLAGAYRAIGEVRKAEAFLRAELDALKESTEPNEILVVQAKIALIDILFYTPVLTSISLTEATVILSMSSNMSLRSALKIALPQ